MQEVIKSTKNKISTLDSYKDYPNKKKVNRKLFNQVIKLVNKKIFQYALTTGKKIEEFRILKYKAKPQNKPLSYQLKKEINYSNLHTDGYTAKFVWMQPKYLTGWSFILLRTHKRRNFKIQSTEPTMAEYIKEHGVDHFVEPKTKLK